MNRRFAALSSFFLLFSIAVVGCGRDAGAARQIASHPGTPQPTTTLAPSTTPLPPAVLTPSAAATPATTPRPRLSSTTTTPVPHPATGAAIAPDRLVYAELRPDTVRPGAPLTGRVHTSGTVSRVTMTIGSGDPRASAPVTFALASHSPGAWLGTVPAPAVPGVYVFTVSLTDPAGERKFFTVDGWTVTVTGPPGPSANASPTPARDAASQPLPDDIPLAPAFAWSNPSPASFSALGTTISGWELSTDARPDIAPSDVADFYANRLPRSGWSVVSQPKGGTAFSIVATNGARVCLVQYAASSVHLFYGTR